MARAMTDASSDRVSQSTKDNPSSASRPSSGWVAPSCRQSAVSAAGLNTSRISARRRALISPPPARSGQSRTASGVTARLSSRTDSWCCGWPDSSRTRSQCSAAPRSSPGSTTCPSGRSATAAISSRVAAKVPVDPATTTSSSGGWSRHSRQRSRTSLLRLSAASITPCSSRMAGQRSIRMVSSFSMSCQCREKRSGRSSGRSSGVASALQRESRSRPSDSASCMACGWVGATSPRRKPRSRRASHS